MIREPAVDPPVLPRPRPRPVLDEDVDPAHTLLDVGRRKLTPADIDRLFALKDRSKSGPTVPSQGLTMVEVHLEESFRL